jgi:hypothetical protein
MEARRFSMREAALRADPDMPAAHDLLGSFFAEKKRLPDATGNMLKRFGSSPILRTHTRAWRAY